MSLKIGTHQRGSALIYILIAIALLGALTASFMDSSGEQNTKQTELNLVSEMKSEIDSIRSAIDECVSTYPSGDNALVGTKNMPYPLLPTDTYLLNPQPLYSLAGDIRCPGNPGNSNNHEKIFSAKTGMSAHLKFGWLYYNGIDGIAIQAFFTNSDPYIEKSLAKLDNLFSKCETQYFDARAGIIQTTSDNNSGYRCLAGYQCFKVWIKPNASAIYPGETGCP